MTCSENCKTRILVFWGKQTVSWALTSWECLTLYKLATVHAALTLVNPAPSNTYLNFKGLQTEDWLQEASYCICESMSGVSQSAVSDSLPLHGLHRPPGSSVHGILQARILEWVAMPSSRGSFQPRDRTWVSCIAGRFFTI